MTQTTEQRLDTLEIMADQVRAYARVTRRLTMALGRELVEQAADPLRVIDRFREWTLDSGEDEAFRAQVERYLAILEAVALDLQPRGQEDSVQSPDP